ncbi:MAG: DUF882 domain-containing protein [Gammaproteobacteria bacterium]
MKTPACNLSRRHFLQTLSVAATGLALYSPWRDVFAAAAQDRTLSFFHTHTGEHLKLTYFSAGLYHDDALVELNRYLRDFRTNEIHPMDANLFDILYAMKSACNSNGTFEVISGYRSPVTNKSLRKQGRGVAEHSLHMVGKAIDIRLTDVNTVYLKKAAASLKRGGVGYYAKSDFIHVDTGRVRYW